MSADRFVFRLARSSDAQQIAEMSRLHIEYGLHWMWRPARIVRQIDNRDSQVLVVMNGTQLVGFAIMSVGDEIAHLNLLAVDPAYRSRGLGRRIVGWLEKTACVAGVFTVTLEVRAQNLSARCFYKALGFNEVLMLRGYYQGIEDAVRLRHELRADVTSS